MRRLARGQGAALDTLFARHGGRVYRLARGMLPQPEDAEDATQEVFLKLLERAGQFDCRARFTTWLHRLTVNLCLNRGERQRQRVCEGLAAELAAEGGDPSAGAAQADECARAAALLERLSPEHRAVLSLRELEGLSYAEIAATLHLPVGTVMSRLARARERLAAEVGEREATKVGALSLPKTRTR